MSHALKEFIVNVPTAEELDAFCKERAEDRCRRSAQNLFNPTNLGHWIDLCRTVDVPYVPELEVARAPTDDWRTKLRAKLQKPFGRRYINS
jgi:hypothetical protein